jgi:hypothetical protein
MSKISNLDIHLYPFVISAWYQLIIATCYDFYPLWYLHWYLPQGIGLAIVWSSLIRLCKLYLRACMATPLWCGMGCHSQTYGRIHRSWLSIKRFECCFQAIFCLVFRPDRLNAKVACFQTCTSPIGHAAPPAWAQNASFTCRFRQGPG